MEVNIKIYQKRLLLEENTLEEFDMEEALSTCFDLIRDSAATWKRLEESPARRLRFQKQLFPEKVTFDGKEFGTLKVSPILEAKLQIGADETKLVTPRGIEPRFQP